MILLDAIMVPFENQYQQSASLTIIANLTRFEVAVDSGESAYNRMAYRTEIVSSVSDLFVGIAELLSCCGLSEYVFLSCYSFEDSIGESVVKMVNIVSILGLYSNTGITVIVGIVGQVIGYVLKRLGEFYGDGESNKIIAECNRISVVRIEGKNYEEKLKESNGDSSCC